MVHIVYVLLPETRGTGYLVSPFHVHGQVLLQVAVTVGHITALDTLASPVLDLLGDPKLP